MTAMLIVVAWLFIVGAPAALLFGVRELRSLFGLAFLLGSGVVCFVLLALPVWTLMRVSVALFAIAVLLWFFALRRGLPAFVARDWSAFDALTLLAIALHAGATTIAPVGEWDFFAVWGLKARVFTAHRGIDWWWSATPSNAFAHADYPPLLPLNYVFAALEHGAWSDRWLGLFTTLFGAALLSIVRDLFARELSPRLASLATLGVATVALSPWIGMAEAPLIAFAASGLLLIRNGDTIPGATLLGLAACTKNEGLTLIVAAAVALLMSARKRDVLRMWPAAAIAAPWLVLRSMHALHTDVAGATMRLEVASIGRVLHSIAIYTPGRPLLWLAIPITLLLAYRDLRRERFTLIAVALQIGFYLAAYAAMRYDIEWHVRYSWARLLDQVAVPLAFVALVLSGQRCDERDGQREDSDQHEDRDHDRGDDRHERHA